MVTRTRPMAMVLVVAAMLVLAGCDGDSGDQTATQAPTTSRGATTEPVPTTEVVDEDSETTIAEPELSAEDQDQAAVEKTLQLYTRAVNDAFNGDASVEEIYPFSRDAAREQWVTEVMAAEPQGITFSGLTELEVFEVSIEGDTVEAVACADVSAVEAVDENGDSILAEDRLDRTLKDYVLERDDSAQFGWYVTEDTNRNEPCDA